MLRLWLCLSLFLVSNSTMAKTVYAPEELSAYKGSQQLAGNISTVGSQTLALLMAEWASLFKSFHPAVNVQIQTSGSASAVTALLEATAQIGTMSRAFNEQEKSQFVNKYGYLPHEIKIGIDIIALFVNQDNPLPSIKLAAVDAIYSQARRCNTENPIIRWGELGLGGSWQNRRIQLFGRNSTSGTYNFFRKKLLCGGDFRSNVNALLSSASVVQAVSSSLNAIGYAGIAYQAAGAKMLPLNIDNNIVSASVENVLSGQYPLSRYLYVYINKKPNQPLPRKEAEFLKLMLSKQGQEQVAAKGFIPLSKTVIQNQLQSLGLSY